MERKGVVSNNIMETQRIEHISQGIFDNSTNDDIRSTYDENIKNSLRKKIIFIMGFLSIICMIVV